MKTIKIAVIEDHTILRETLVSAFKIQKDFRIAGHFGDAESFLEFMDEPQKIDVAVIDKYLTGMDGIMLARELRKISKTVGIIILSMHLTEQDVYEALKYNVRGYLHKTASLKELSDAVRNVAKGELTFSSDISDKVLKYFADVMSGSKEHCQNDINDDHRKIIESIRDGMTNKEISAKMGVTEAIIKARLRTIFKKIGAADRTQAVIKAIEAGIIPDLKKN